MQRNVFIYTHRTHLQSGAQRCVALLVAAPPVAPLPAVAPLAVASVAVVVGRPSAGPTCSEHRPTSPVPHR